MAELAHSIPFFLPESLLILGMVLLFVVDLALPKGALHRRPIAAGIAVGTLAVAGVLCGMFYLPAGTRVPLFHGMAVADAYSCFFRLLFVVAGVIVAIAAYPSPEVEGPRAPEFFILLLGMTLGMFLLVGASSLLMIALAIEFLSVPSYVLTGFKRADPRSAEAALKYVVFGAAASGIMLFGFSYLYGLTGSLDVETIGRTLAQRLAGATVPAHEKLVLSVAAVMGLTGFGYKIAAVPFHPWCPDVYEGAPTPVTALLSVGPKAAGIAALVRFCIGVFGTSAEPWPLLLGIVAAATMTLGNLVAIPQDNIKRLLAYSSIAHAGYILMAVATFSTDAVTAVMFYLAIYVLMNLGAFMVVIAVRDSSGGREDLATYLGLAQRHPVLAVSMALCLLSLVGLPPLGGFVAKFYVFAALLRKASLGGYVLALVGVLNSVISLFYYARVIKAMFLAPAEAPGPESAAPARGTVALAAVLALALLVLGLYWGPLRAWSESSVLTWR